MVISGCSIFHAANKQIINIAITKTFTPVFFPFIPGFKPIIGGKKHPQMFRKNPFPFRIETQLWRTQKCKERSRFRLNLAAFTKESSQESVFLENKQKHTQTNKARAIRGWKERGISPYRTSTPVYAILTNVCEDSDFSVKRVENKINSIVRSECNSLVQNAIKLFCYFCLIFHSFLSPYQSIVLHSKATCYGICTTLSCAVF